MQGRTFDHIEERKDQGWLRIERLQRDRKRGVVTFKFSLHHPSSHKRLCEPAIYVAEVDASTNGQQASGLPRHRCGLVGSYIARNGKMQLPDQDGRSA